MQLHTKIYNYPAWFNFTEYLGINFLLNDFPPFLFHQIEQHFLLA